ncbi:MAG: hypothetical protein NC543_14370 [bacterium]|nr:hypothetical protein [bacterium]MCM1376527.1 hypothetical protein [Muribaculum sp.]
MRRTDRQIKRYLAAGTGGLVETDGLRKAVQRSRQAFYECEKQGVLSQREFLFQQSRYIKKHWWLLQGAILAVLWLSLVLTRSSYYMQRYMGIAAPLFGALILPELWKNRSAGAMEIEGAAYFSLRQIYAARIFLFALVDFVLLCVFSLGALFGGTVAVRELLAQFFLPYVVTCCICFKTLYSRRVDSEAFALSLCAVWSLVWLMILSDEKIYHAVSLPVWLAMLGAVSVYLGYCVWRGQRDCENLLEVKSLWN